MDWKKSSDRSLREAYRRRVRMGREIEAELNAELAARFSDYNSHTNTFDKGVDWASYPKRLLRTAYRYRIQHGKKIEQKLNDALAQKFPEYDPETQQFNPLNWTKSSDKSLREIHRRRVRMGLEIDAELNAELARRFPSYNPETKKFIETPKRGLSELADISILSTYYRRRKDGREIEPELSDELKRRFHGYDPIKQTFVGRYASSKKRDWSAMSLSGLRSAYLRRCKNGREIEPALNAELAHRFANYDPKTQSFVYNKLGKDTENRLAEMSNKLIYREYKKRRLDGTPIDAVLNAELARRFPSYNPQRRCFTKNRATVNSNWSELSYGNLRAAYTKRYVEGRKIEPELNAELARRFSNYDSESQTFGQNNGSCGVNNRSLAYLSKYQLMQKYNHAIAAGTGIDDELHAELLHRFERYDSTKRRMSKKVRKASNLKTYAELKDSTLRGMYYKYKDPNNIPDDLNMELGRRFATYNMSSRRFVRVNKINLARKAKMISSKQSIPVTGFNAASARELRVTVRPINDMYNDVYINGTRILHNHMDTRVETFAGGILLAVHGTVTTDENYPSTRPVWLVYSADGRVNRWAGTEKWKGYKVYIKSIQDIPSMDALRVMFSNDAMRILQIASERRRTGEKVFKIVRKKTK
ncbi:hypothetical protein HDR66_02175 [bacterium]|nr:hypothetical protein [bacterium]